MDKHICRQCGKVFNYCRSCVFKAIPWKEAGFCSRECSAEHKKPKTEEVIPVEDVEVVVIKEDTSTPKENAIECPYFFTDNNSAVTTIDEAKIKKKKSKKAEDALKENGINEDKQDHGQNI